jgi:hypothetical protein
VLPGGGKQEAKSNRITLDARSHASIMKTYFDVNSRAVQFPSVCNQCGHGGETRMCVMGMSQYICLFQLFSIFILV